MPGKNKKNGRFRGKLAPARPNGGPAPTPVRLPTLSLCLITKDEERFLERCIKSVKGLCQQVVVVDTGSTDRTVEIAKACGAEVHYFEWNDSFADARNETVTYATGDWILVMDADHELDRDSHDPIRRLITRHRYPSTFMGKSINYQGDGSFVTESLFRIPFPNGHGIRYEGGVHEQIASADPNVQLENIVADIYVHHYGYLNEVIEKKGKAAFYGKLADKELIANPDDFTTRYHAGQYFSSSAHWKRAEEQYLWCLDRLENKSFANGPRHWWFALVLSSLASVYANTGRFQEAVDRSHESLPFD